MAINKWYQEKICANPTEKLKLAICENFMMDNDNLTESSNTITEDHFLYPFVVRVRADCVFNPYAHSVESGTSYAAPMVAGAIAASGNMDHFREQLTGKIMTAESLAELSSQEALASSLAKVAPVAMAIDVDSTFADAAVAPEPTLGLGEGISPPEPVLTGEDREKIFLFVPGSDSTILLKSSKP